MNKTQLYIVVALVLLCTILASSSIGLFLVIKNHKARALAIENELKMLISEREAIKSERDTMIAKSKDVASEIEEEESKLNLFQNSLKEQVSKREMMEMHLADVNSELSNIEEEQKKEKSIKIELAKRLENETKNQKDLAQKLLKLQEDNKTIKAKLDELLLEKQKTEEDRLAAFQSASDVKESAAMPPASEEKPDAAEEIKLSSAQLVMLPEVKATKEAEKVVKEEIEVTTERAAPKEKVPPKKAKAAEKEEPSQKKETPIGPTSAFEGEVLRINRDFNFVIVDIGNNKGMKAGSILSIYHDGLIVGEVEVEKVLDELSVGAIPSVWKDKELIRKGDSVKIIY